jgi:hypothetical protein
MAADKQRTRHNADADTRLKQTPGILTAVFETRFFEGESRSRAVVDN